MKFLESLTRYFYDGAWLRLYNQNMGFMKGVWRYTRLCFLMGVLAFAGFLVLSFLGKQRDVHLSPDMIASNLSSLSQSFLSTYPTGLVIDIASTGVTTNATGPVVFPLPDVLSGMLDHYTTMLIVDTSTGATLAGYTSGFMLLSRDALSIRRSLVEVRTFAIAEIMKESPPVHLTHEYVATLVDSIGQKLYEQRWEIYRKAIGFGLIGGLIAFMVVSGLVGFFVALSVYLYALIVWFVGALCLPGYTYGKAYADALLFYTWPWIAGLVFGLDRIQQGLLVAVVAVWVLYRERMLTGVDSAKE